MLAPILITAPAETPVSLDEAKAHLRVDFDDDDTLIKALIQAATQHLDGWTGVLGRALVTQTWRQEFQTLSLCGLRLPLGPVASLESVTYIDAAGTTQALAADQYSLLTDCLGPIVIPLAGASWPATARRPNAVAITYIAGTAVADVPAPIKWAILLIIGNLYANREAIADKALAALPMAVDALLAPYRRVGL